MLDARIGLRQTEAGVPPEQQDEQPPLQDSLTRFHLVSEPTVLIVGCSACRASSCPCSRLARAAPSC